MRPAQLLLLDRNLWTFFIKIKNCKKIRKRISQLVAKQWTFSFNLTNISDRKIQKIQFGVNNTHLFSSKFKTGTTIVRHFVLFQLRLIIINHIGIWQIGLIRYSQKWFLWSTFKSCHDRLNFQDTIPYLYGD